VVSAQREVTVGGIRLAYRVAGAADAPPMVLLHALGEQGASWEAVTPAFAWRFRVFALDLREARPTEFAKAVLEWLDSEGRG
jgi:pimeloyl-ACP methyl ester carboxylesterase